MRQYIFFLTIASLIFLTGCSSSDKYEYDGVDYSDQYDATTKECIEPENLYGDGGGHDAGRERGEEGNSCGGNSQSFINGCEEYYEAYDHYEMCLSANE